MFRAAEQELDGVSSFLETARLRGFAEEPECSGLWPSRTIDERAGRPAPRSRVLDSETEHTIKNHLAVIVGFCELLLAETPSDNPRHADVHEISHAARELMAIFRRDTRH